MYYNDVVCVFKHVLFVGGGGSINFKRTDLGGFVDSELCIMVFRKFSLSQLLGYTVD